MAGATLLPEAHSLALEELVAADGGVTMVVRACRPTACCPDCGAIAVERFFGRVCRFFGLQRPRACGWTAIVWRVAAQQAERPDLIRAPKRVLAHLWEGPTG